MSVGVGEISWSSDVVYFCLFLVNCFKDSGVEDWSLSSWVDSDKEDGISILNHLDL